MKNLPRRAGFWRIRDAGGRRVVIHRSFVTGRTPLRDRGTRLRGYLNSNWQFEPLGAVQACLSEAGHEHDLVGRYQALGSRMHVNFAAQPEFLPHFVQPIVERVAAG